MSADAALESPPDEPAASEASELLVVGKLGAPHGVRGWLKVNAFLQPPESLLDFDAWLLEDGPDQWTEVRVRASRITGRAPIVLLEDCNDRDTAALLTGLQIALPRGVLPAPEPDEFYWHDLIGMRVVTVAGEELGAVETLLETGANDVMLVKGERERLVPFVLESVVKSVDMDAASITVDWHPDD